MFDCQIEYLGPLAFADLEKAYSPLSMYLAVLLMHLTVSYTANVSGPFH